MNQHPGKPEWSDMLMYVADLHRRSIQAPLHPFPHPWEAIGPGYCYGPAFGHWDIVHALFDNLPLDAAHVRHQLENNFAGQQADGLLPGAIYVRDGKTRWNRQAGHPPVWPVVVQDYIDLYGPDLLPRAYEALVRQIAWFEQHRKATGEGFFYTDILNHCWESGVDEGIRFLETQPGPFACVDASSHVFALYTYAARWGRALGEAGSEYQAKAEALQAFISRRLFVEETGFFHDSWAVEDPARRCICFEGLWPVIVGAATPEQARRVIRENLMNPRKLLCKHPVATVALDDPRFELRMWRGPAWNSMTYWAARGCVRYGAQHAAGVLLERALDDSAAQFARTGTIWEFYHPLGGRPEDVQRKPHTEFNQPCRDYLGHNPLPAMARLYEQVKSASE
jgi:putative isomerase